MDTFIEISIILVIAATFSGFVKFLKQPMIIGYILTGLIVGPYALNIVNSNDTLEVFSQFGITLLLFIVGLNLSPKVIKEVGRVAVITGLGQVIFTTIVGFLIATFLGYSTITAVFIAIALTFSSTIIILKLLSDKGDLEKLYGKIAIGFLIIQDLVASFLLISVSALSLGNNLSEIALQLIYKGGIILFVLFICVKFLLPSITKYFAKSQEFLFLFAIAWGMGIAAVFNILGFSMEIGALIAGVSLSLFPYHHEISSKMRPLRDFFLVVFFILLGSQLIFSNFTQLMLPAILFSIFVLIGNPLIMMILMGILGYNRRTSFLAGLTVAQVSEFSLILIALGVKVGDLSQEILSLVTIVALITITFSSYMIMYADKIYPLISKYLIIFERKNVRKDKERVINYDVILFGYNRIGYDFLKVFKRMKSKFMVVDFDPEVIQSLVLEEIPCEYGDAGDTEFLDEIGLSQVKMVVSTIPDFSTNAILISKAKSLNPKAIILVISHDIEDTYKLYDLGATYVYMPHFLGGKYASNLVNRHKFDSKKFNIEKERHIKSLDQRI